MNIHLKELEKKLQYEFHDENLFSQALTHSSYANEHRLDHSRCNECLEFLGDAVLEIVTSDFLYHNQLGFPMPEPLHGVQYGEAAWKKQWSLFRLYPHRTRKREAQYGSGKSLEYHMFHQSPPDFPLRTLQWLSFFPLQK